MKRFVPRVIDDGDSENALQKLERLRVARALERSKEGHNHTHVFVGADLPQYKHSKDEKSVVAYDKRIHPEFDEIKDHTFSKSHVDTCKACRRRLNLAFGDEVQEDHLKTLRVKKCETCKVLTAVGMLEAWRNGANRIVYYYCKHDSCKAIGVNTVQRFLDGPPVKKADQHKPEKPAPAAVGSPGWTHPHVLKD